MLHSEKVDVSAIFDSIEVPSTSGYFKTVISVYYVSVGCHKSSG